MRRDWVWQIWVPILSAMFWAWVPRKHFIYSSFTSFIHKACDPNIFSASLFIHPICSPNKYLGSICPDADVMQAVNLSLSFLLKSLQIWELQSQSLLSYSTNILAQTLITILNEKPRESWQSRLRGCCCSVRDGYELGREHWLQTML